MPSSYWLKVWVWWAVVEVKWLVRGKSWLLADRTAKGVDVGLHWVHNYCVNISEVSRGKYVTMFQVFIAYS